MPANLTPPQRIAYLCHLFNGEVQYLRVVGALLAFLVQNAMLSTLHGQNEHGVMTQADDTIHVSSISYRDYCNTLHISAMTMRSLNVFNDESHPMSRGGLKGKEGDSLYAMMKRHVKSKPGTQLLRSWLTYPSTNKAVIEARQFLVQMLMDPINRSLIVAVQDALQGLPNVRSLMTKFRSLVTDLGDWKGLYKACTSFMSLLDTFKAAVRDEDALRKSELIRKLTEINEADINDVLSWIYSGIDVDESVAMGRLVVAQGLNEEVDKLKEQYAGMDEFLSRVGQQEYRKLISKETCPPLRWLQLIYDIQLGFLIVLPKDAVEEHHVNRWRQVGLEFAFNWEKRGYCFRNSKSQQLDRDIGSIHMDIIEKERQAIRFVIKHVVEREQTMCEMADLVCQLDVLQALAECARHNSWTIPTVLDADDAEMIVEDGWFPLLENKVTSIVRNPIKIKIGDVHVVTG